MKPLLASKIIIPTLANALPALASVDADPDKDLGYEAEIGSLLFNAQLDDPSAWVKTGPANTTWVNLITAISVKSRGAKGDGITDDTAAIQEAVSLAMAQGKNVSFEPGTYRTTSLIDFFGAVRMSIIGVGAVVIRYPSDDESLVASPPVSLIDRDARSAFSFRYCADCTVTNLTFQGGTRTQTETVNIGSGIYSRHTTGLRIVNCCQVNGFSLVNAEAQGDTSGAGDSIAVSAGVVTVTDASALFNAGHVGRRLALAGCVNVFNNGEFLVTRYLSPTQIQFENVDAIDETSQFKWQINDGDRDLVVDGGRSDGPHGYCALSPSSEIVNHYFSWPTRADVTGIGDAFAIAGSTVTLTDTGGQGGGRFLPRHSGCYVVIAGASSPSNNGTFKLTYISSTQISWTNASGVAETFTGTWWILGAAKTGLGAGAGALAQSGSTTRVTSAISAFSATDVGKMLRVTGATLNNNTGSIISAFISPTQVDIYNPNGASEAFSGVWTINEYDNGQDASGNTNGSTHAIYLFGGRQDIKVRGCTFIGNRTCCIKISGTNPSLRSFEITNNIARECAAFVIFGADDTNEHTGLVCSGNILIDCATQRVGWDATNIINIEGSRGVNITNNVFYFTRNSVNAIEGLHGVGSIAAIQAFRRVENMSQPVENVNVIGNAMCAEPSCTTAVSIIFANIAVQDVGIRAKWSSTGTLAVSSGIMTLTDASALFDQGDVGKTIRIVNAAAGNNGTFTIKTVISKTQLTFANAGSNGSAGTYGIAPLSNQRGGSCTIMGNQILNVGTVGIDCLNNVGPDVSGNIYSGILAGFRFHGDVAPRAINNRMEGDPTLNAGSRIDSGTSWPYFKNNMPTNAALGSSGYGDIGIGVDGTVRVDYPLLGSTGLVRPSQGREEVVFAYGSLHVDGDSVTVTLAGSASVFTFKLVAPGANQFNTFAGLLALINAKAGVIADDYGTGYASGNVSTQHIRVRRTVATADTVDLTVTTIALNPTALVYPRNKTNFTVLEGRGAGSLGAVPDKTVIWSLQSEWACAIDFHAANAAARTLLSSGSAAIGTITSVAAANFQPGNVDVMTISDGFNPTVQYYFDTTGGGGGVGIQVSLAGLTTAAQVAAALRAAILTNQPVLNVVDNGNGTLTVTHKMFGSVGNNAMTEAVADPGFAVSGLSEFPVGRVLVMAYSYGKGIWLDIERLDPDVTAVALDTFLAEGKAAAAKILAPLGDFAGLGMAIIAGQASSLKKGEAVASGTKKSSRQLEREIQEVLSARQR